MSNHSGFKFLVAAACVATLGAPSVVRAQSAAGAPHTAAPAQPASSNAPRADDPNTPDDYRSLMGNDADYSVRNRVSRGSAGMGSNAFPRTPVEPQAAPTHTGNKHHVHANGASQAP